MMDGEDGTPAPGQYHQHPQKQQQQQQL